MRGLAVVACVFLHSCLCYGKPASTDGVGAFAYQDSTGNRYGGTYGLRGGQVVDVKGDYPPPGFGPPRFQDIDDFFPEYFRNLQYLFQEAFGSDTRNLNVALSAANKAYDIASNQVGYMPNFDFRFPPFGGFPDFAGQSIAMPYGMSDNSAYAGAAAGPGFSQHRAFINPANPQNPNVDVTKTHSNTGRNGGGHYSVSSSSYASSSNVDGQVKSFRGAETKVDNNGEITHYRVQS